MTAYPFLKDNIEYLQNTGNPAFHWLSSQNFKEEQLLKNLFINKHNFHDWRMENGEGMFENLPPMGVYGTWLHDEKAQTSATFIVGSNLGYGVNHVLQGTPDSHKVMLLEPRPEMLLACLGQTDYRPFFESKKFHIMVPDDKFVNEVIRNLDLQFIYGQIHLKGDIPSQQLGPEYAKWTHVIKHRLEDFSLELSTLRYRQDIMVGNEINNFKRAMEDGSLKSLEGKAAGVGAVILGAGPSLEKMAPALKENPGHALYGCAFQTMPILQRLDFKPHFCMAIDYNASLMNTFAVLDPDFAKDVPLIYSTKVNPEIIKTYPGPTLPLWTVGGVGTYVLKERDLVLDAGGNVSVTLSRFLRWCGVNHLLLVGLDFAFVNNKTHSYGHQDGGGRGDNHSVHMTKNMAGEEIETTIQYMTAKRELEEDLKDSPFPTFNLYGGGTVIEGTKVVDMDTVKANGILASAPGSVDRFRTDLVACHGITPPLNLEPRSPMWTTSMRNAEKHLGKLFKNCAKNQSEIHGTFERIELFIKQDPLYMPYLFNEVIDLAGLTRAKIGFAVSDLNEFKKIAKKILKKVREIDRKVCDLNKKNVAA